MGKEEIDFKHLAEQSQLNETKFNNVTKETIDDIVNTYPIQPLFTRVVISLNRKISSKSGIILPSNPLEEVQYVIAAGSSSVLKPGMKIILDLDKMTVKRPSKTDVTQITESIKIEPLEVEGFDVYGVIYDNQVKAYYK